MSIAATGLFQVCPTLAAASRRAPKTLRYRVLNTAARLVRGGRRRYLKIQATWPWAESITAAWQCIDALLQAP